MNKGEWGEPYTALRLLGDRKLYMADANGNINSHEWMDVLKIIRAETATRTVTYVCTDPSGMIEIEINGVPTSQISATRFLQIANLLRHEIVEGRGRSFNVSEEVQDFLSEAEIKHLKAKSIDKSDIFLDTRDPRTSIVRQNIGFSIKAEFGKDPTIFNTGTASAAKYKITSNMTHELMNEINSLMDNRGHASVSARCDALRENGCSLEWVGYEYAPRAHCCAFNENLDLINPHMPKVIERILWNHFMEGNTDVNIPDVIQRIIVDNPCGVSRPEDKYPFMIKQFLYAAYCGMTAGTLWDGRSAVKGGYITVKQNGDVVANYAMESDPFKNFLYTHCYMDYPSTEPGHGNYGNVIFENGEYFFKLNFQIRIC